MAACMQDRCKTTCGIFDNHRHLSSSNRGKLCDFAGQLPRALPNHSSRCSSVLHSGGPEPCRNITAAMQELEKPCTASSEDSGPLSLCGTTLEHKPLSSLRSRRSRSGIGSAATNANRLNKRSPMGRSLGTGQHPCLVR